MSNTQIAQFSDSEVSDAIAQVQVVGKTTSEKRLSVIAQSSNCVKLFAANQTGKVGAAARSGLFESGLHGIAVHALGGNYAPMAQSLSLITASNVSISNRASYESLVDRFEPALAQLETEGKMWNKAGDKLSSKANQLTQCLMLIKTVQAGIEAIVAQRNN